jgi:hypothetical protein
MGVGIPELVVMLTIGAFWLIPVAAGVWALITLRRIRSAQEEMFRKLDAIERQVRPGPAS